MKPFSTATLTRRLMVAFVLLALLFGTALNLMIRKAILVAEDKVSMHYLEANVGRAESLFLTGAVGPQRLDAVTMAYNDPQDLPEIVPEAMHFAGPLQGEIEDDNGDLFILVAQYRDGPEQKSVYLPAQSKSLELTEHEGDLIVLSSVLITAMLFACFGYLLLRLSSNLIRPFNDLNRQLAEHKGDLNRAFFTSKHAALEFQQLTAELNHYRSEISLLVKREQAFARYTSHELRTPLTVIRGSARLLEQSDKPEFRARQQHRISQAARQMEETIEALLSLVRYERCQPHEERPFTITELEHILEQNRSNALGKALEFKLIIDDEPILHASEAAMGMLVGNLIRNDIAASTQGLIELSLSKQALIVTDQGLGLEHTEHAKDGHGLGLLIVTELCSRYGWQFSLKARSEGGTVAQIDFTAR